MKVGLYGGSFNPIHNGHVAVARAVREEFGLDLILFMVAKDPPHKELAGHVPAQTRLSMCQLALAGEAGLCASALEMARPGKSYTIETVRELQSIFAGAELYCIVGTDMLFDLPNWREAQSLMRACAFIGVGRGGMEEDLEAQAQKLRAAYGATVLLSRFTGPALSSTHVRERVFAAQPIDGLVPAQTERYIYEEALYMPPAIAGAAGALRASLSPGRYSHTMGTLRCAVALAARYGEDAARTRLAALLHDCAKLSLEEQYALAARYGLDLDALEAVSPAILHGPIGAAHAREAYGVQDEAVLAAIYWHTLCRENMTKLEKIVYLADKIEAGRAYPGLDAIRSAAEESLDAGVLACMEQSIRYIEQKGGRLHPNVLRARDFIEKERMQNA